MFRWQQRWGSLFSTPFLGLAGPVPSQDISAGVLRRCTPFTHRDPGIREGGEPCEHFVFQVGLPRHGEVQNSFDSGFFVRILSERTVRVWTACQAGQIATSPAMDLDVIGGPRPTFEHEHARTWRLRLPTVFPGGIGRGRGRGRDRERERESDGDGERWRRRWRQRWCGGGDREDADEGGGTDGLSLGSGETCPRPRRRAWAAPAAAVAAPAAAAAPPTEATSTLHTSCVNRSVALAGTAASRWLRVHFKIWMHPGYPRNVP